MIANSFLDIYTGIFSWKVYGVLWDTLNGTGLAYIPFIAAIINSLKQAYDQSAERVVKTLEWDLFGMIIVLILVVIPYQNNAVAIGDVQYTITTTSCNKADVAGEGDDTGKAADDVFSDLAGAGSSIRMPIAWGLVEYLSSSITYTAIKSMGCAFSYDEMMHNVANVTVDDAQMLERLDEFNQQCYKPALADMQARGLPAGTVRSELEAWEDPSFIGSSLLLNTPGAYYQSDQAYVHQAQRYGFEYNTAYPLDEGHDEATFGATVTCKELWEGRGDAPGLRAELFESITESDEGEDAWDDWDDWGSELYGPLTASEEQETFIKAVLDANAGNYASVDNISVANEGYVETSWTDPQTWLNGLTDLVAGGVAAWDAAGTWAQMMVIKNAMKTAVPMLIAMAQALVIIIAPFAMVWGRFKLDNFIILAIGYFGLEFFNAILAMGYYFENKISLMSNKAIMQGEIFASVTVYLVSFMQLFILPSLWAALVIATGSTALKGMNGLGGSDRGTYGSSGSSTATNMALSKAGSGITGALKK